MEGEGRECTASALPLGVRATVTGVEESFSQRYFEVHCLRGFWNSGPGLLRIMKGWLRATKRMNSRGEGGWVRLVMEEGFMSW